MSPTHIRIPTHIRTAGCVCVTSRRILHRKFHAACPSSITHQNHHHTTGHKRCVAAECEAPSTVPKSVVKPCSNYVEGWVLQSPCLPLCSSHSHTQQHDSGLMLCIVTDNSSDEVRSLMTCVGQHCLLTTPPVCPAPSHTNQCFAQAQVWRAWHRTPHAPWFLPSSK